MFIAGLFILAATAPAEIAERRGLASDATDYRAEASKMAGSVVEHGWDGAWFRRAYDYFGNAVGPCENEEGKIFVEPPTSPSTASRSRERSSHWHRQARR